MAQNNIHPTAIVEEGAQIGSGVTIEPYAVIKSGVTLHDGATVKGHAYIDGNTQIGSGTVIYPFASIGTQCQDLKFQGEKTYIEIGERCEIREYVTINSSTGEGNAVRIGNDTMIMAYAHVGHNCDVGNNVVMANNVALAGHVVVEDYAYIGGHTPIHQRTQIGCYAMVGGFSRILYDVPPFTIGTGIDTYRLGGLNLIGLKRHGFDLPTRQALSRAFKIMFRSGLHKEEALARIEDEVELIPEIEHWLEFCRRSSRGISGLQGVVSATDEPFLGIEELCETIA